MRKRILVVEDDQTLNDTLCFHLRKQNYSVDSVGSVKGMEKQYGIRYDLAILDIDLPDGNGYEICKELKELYPETAVIFLTVHDLEKDFLKGYEVGASDYITKPFSIQILLSKMKALFLLVAPGQNGIYQDVSLTIDFQKYSCSYLGKDIALTPMEYRLLEVLIKHSGQVLSRGQLLQWLWDDEGYFVDEHALTAAISRLRKKIELEQIYIKTIYGIGYVWQGGKL